MIFAVSREVFVKDECLFGDAKTRGLNLEDTRITNPGKLATLLGILALASNWAYRCATQAMGRRAIARKTLGRREKPGSASASMP